MRTHHTKTKGNLAVLKVKADVYEKGWLPLQPESEHEPFDLAIYKNGVFLMVQVKYSTAKNGAICVNLRNSWADKNGSHSTRSDQKSIDIFAVYCKENNTCYYVLSSESANYSCSMLLRIDGGGNSKSLKAIDFTEIKL